MEKRHDSSHECGARAASALRRPGLLGRVHRRHRRTRHPCGPCRGHGRATRQGLPFQHPIGIIRIHWHWTGGGHEPNASDLKAYHALINGEGKIRWPVDPTTARSHTLNANGGAIGLSICAMAGAQERPFVWGKAPITPAQVSVLVRETARLCRTYDIPISRWSTLSHAEIQPTLGVTQKNKWDITVLPGMTATADPIAVGDRLRDLAARELSAL
ncbi:N-acetylmuramoyl-L-alanine amidase [Paracoccus sp. (in: a-proteobacteria)]|uniref:peptidoglycan recognition protein family protein n=1 Tax=Paracoccus sp. TaxID=267 RepID=UPI002AFFFC78|nr:N-acetylmuramoyl-L-alanine amidase [Paracoccus sp. (in: a-proteobacteria)]